MSDAWMPGVRYVRAGADGGPLKGGAPRVVWQVLGADPQTVSARSAAQRLDQDGQASHLVWNPLIGEIVQLIPIVRAACSLGRPEPAGRVGGLGQAPWLSQAVHTEVSAEGRVCVQICVVAFAHRPFTAAPMAGLLEIMTWLDSWGVPRSWPAGGPATCPDCHEASRSRRLWARGGHFGASQVPGLTATGPGAIDVQRLTGWSAGHSAATGVGTAGRSLGEATPSREAGYDPVDLGEFLGDHVAGAATLTTAR